MPFLTTCRAASNCCAGFVIASNARACPISNSRASLQISLQAAGKTVWQTTLEPGGDLVEIDLRLPPCKDFSIAVAYDGKVAVPAGVEWLDAHLLSAAAVAK